MPQGGERVKPAGRTRSLILTVALVFPLRDVGGELDHGLARLRGLDAREGSHELHAVLGRHEVGDEGRLGRLGEALAFLGAGEPWKKNPTSTPRTCAMSIIRPTLIRLVPFSYFWTCWKVSPSISPSFSWLMPMSIRRIRMRLPMSLSI